MSKVKMIDANALLKSETERCHCVPLVCTTALNGMACDCDSLKNVLERQPTIEAEPVCYAVWVNDTYCSNCKRFPVDVSAPISNQELTKHFSRCPHCGAKMKKEVVE
jgi:hypothetical protein